MSFNVTRQKIDDENCFWRGGSVRYINDNDKIIFSTSEIRPDKPIRLCT